jgi:hypothetical protein
MNLHDLPSRLSPKYALIGGILLAVLLAGGVVVALSSGGASDATEPTPDLSAAAPDVAPTSTPQPTPEPTATPVPPSATNRASCDAIRSTPYLSNEERDWFIANCGANPAAANDRPAAGAGAGGQVPIGDTLVIPAAGVTAEVYRVTVPGSGAMPDPQGYFNALWYDFSNWPGLGGYMNAGNLVLSGHVDCARCQNGGPGLAVFYNVRKLAPGDTAEYRAADGKVVKYVVTESYVMSASTDFEHIVSSGTADLTLITCTGTFSGGHYDNRHVVAFKKV